MSGVKALWRVVVNGRTVRVPAHSSLLSAARAAGVRVPTLCHHPRLPARAACRVCVVRSSAQRKLVPACATALSHDG